MKFGSFACEKAVGVILAHTLRLPSRVLKKGKKLSSDDVEDILEAGVYSITGACLESGDMDEDSAALAVATSLAGPNLTVGKPMGGRCNLYAKAQGLVQVDRACIDALNQVNGAITVATLAEHAEALAEQAVATIKVIPFAVNSSPVNRCCELAEQSTTAVSLRPYRAQRAALVLTETVGTKATVLESTREVTRQRLSSLGSQLVSTSICAHTPDAVAEALDQIPPDCELILICGATVTVDVADVVPTAIVRAGGTIDHFGMPVEPGNMLLLAHKGSRSVINMPGCSRSPKLNGLDWVLQRLLAGIEVGRDSIQTMGVGGLIKDLPYVERVKRARHPPAKMPAITAVILAAGRSSRMGEQNKMLSPVHKMPMIQHVVSAALDSKVQQVIVVTGHEAAQVQANLDSERLTVVSNPAFEEGMASSLRCGLQAVSEEVDGAVVLLGDMPFVSSPQIDELIAEFNPLMERDIVAPFKDGRRGNPVLWSRRYFPAMMALSGDVGARHLLSEYAGNVWDVPFESDAIFTDIDTPEALAAIEQSETK